MQEEKRVGNYPSPTDIIIEGKILLYKKYSTCVFGFHVVVVYLLLRIKFTLDDLKINFVVPNIPSTGQNLSCYLDSGSLWSWSSSLPSSLCTCVHICVLSMSLYC